MNTVGYVFLGVVFAIAYVSPTPTKAATNDQSISLFGIAIGEEKETVLQVLKGRSITCAGEGSVPECDSWFVRNNDGPPFITYANVFFKNSRVESVYKYWDRGFQGSNPTEFFQTMYDLISKYTRQGPTNLIVETVEQGELGFIEKNIFLSSGRKTIKIWYVKGATVDGKEIPPFVSLSELLK